MEQVVINLIRNAMEAVPDHGAREIVVEAKRTTNGRTRLSIADNGRGIDADTLPKIFIPFFTTRPKGTGIGLSLSQQIMKMHNGSIRVQSEPGKGSVFVLEW
jgi:signal transduction histidine kinase